MKADRGESSLGGGEDVVRVTSKTTTVEEMIISEEHHENRPHHPGRSDIEHLDDPSTSEEIVHADRHPVRTEDLLKQGQGKRGFSTSAMGRQTDQSPQHLEKSGLPHVDQPTLSEEIIHAERFEVDPLEELKQTKKVEIKYEESSAPIVVKMGTQAVEPAEAVQRGDVSLFLCARLWLGANGYIDTEGVILIVHMWSRSCKKCIDSAQSLR